MSKIQEIALAIEQGKSNVIEGLVQEALDAGDDPIQILNDGMIGAMNIVGADFQANKTFVPNMLLAAKAMKKGVEVLRPHLAAGNIDKHGKFIVGTVQGDMHDIGKNLVSMMVESSGFEVIDLGADVPAKKFVETIKANPDCKVVGLSALLTTSLKTLKETVSTLVEAGCHEQVKIMVGGAPITPTFASDIGADGFTADAGSAAVKAVELATA